MFYSIKKLRKNLEGKLKVPTFALAKTGEPDGRKPERFTEKIFLKKIKNICKVQKKPLTLQTLSL